MTHEKSGPLCFDSVVPCRPVPWSPESTEPGGDCARTQACVGSIDGPDPLALPLQSIALVGSSSDMVYCSEQSYYYAVVSILVIVLFTQTKGVWGQKFSVHPAAAQYCISDVNLDAPTPNT